MSRHVLARLAAGGTWTSPVAPTSTLRSLRHVALPALPKSRPGILPRDPRLHARPPPQDSWTLRGSASDQVDWSWPGAFEAHRVYRCGSDASACTECGASMLSLMRVSCAHAAMRSVRYRTNALPIATNRSTVIDCRPKPGSNCLRTIDAAPVCATVPRRVVHARILRVERSRVHARSNVAMRGEDHESRMGQQRPSS